MKTLAAVVALLITWPEVANLSAQSAARPDFSGQWFMEKTDADATAPSRLWNACWWECELIQNVKTLAVTTSDGRSVTFRLDGVSEKTVSSLGGFKAETTRSAVWSGTTLILTSTTGQFESTTRLSLVGGRLIAETRRLGRGGEPETIKSVYQRKPPKPSRSSSTSGSPPHRPRLT